MGDPRKIRKKYQTPGHPWQRARIEEERTLMKEYGFKNKREIWKMNSFLRHAKAQAKMLVTQTDVQGERERKLLLSRLQRLGLLKTESSLDSILSITLRDVLERRLQTQVYRKTLASSVDQARQLITHQHIMIGGKTVTSPCYVVPLVDEASIVYHPHSSFSNADHPERVAMLVTKKTKTPRPDNGDTKGERGRFAGRKPQRQRQKQAHRQKEGATDHNAPGMRKVHG
ncbi:30S ribosomal protein S4 [Candidatus Woesearchaeota archaeon]|nr:30S ribosomal protein S4 [Candidatus Woesearchaeota archaeon]